MKNLISFFTALLLFFCLAQPSSAKSFELKSPDEKILIKISTSDSTCFSVFYNDIEVVRLTYIYLKTGSGSTFGFNSKVKNHHTGEINEIIFPAIPDKYKEISNHCNQLSINFKDKFGLIFRAYNDGVAYRFTTNLKNDITIVDEGLTLQFSSTDSIYFPEEESFLTHSERAYPYLAIKDITEDQMCCLPALVCRSDGIRIALLESDLLDYPGLYLTGNPTNGASLKSTFPKYPITEEQKNDRTVVVTKTADFIAKTEGARSYPWRAMIITDNDGDLIESNMVYKLATPNKLTDFFWIQPGKVAWDWWNALNLYNVDFESGLNTDTYKYYIDFAPAYGIEYIILDEGWSDTEDLSSINPDIDIPGLMEYAKSKNVGIILWVVWLTLDEQLEETLNQFEAWGVKGIKVDFMQRDDQIMVNYYEKIAKEAAKRKLLVDFHGSYKPTGLRRTYPNVLTREGVRGLEWNKWSNVITPDHDLTIPFTRMLAGPMDFTPGAMINAGEDHFEAHFSRPMSQGTRCHQLAMYVIYDSPLQMLADSPSNYKKESGVMDFLSKVPSVWNDTKVLKAKIGDYLVMARKHNDKWYIGGMTDWSPNTFAIDLSFLGPGTHTLSYWADGINASKNAIDYQKGKILVNNKDQISIKMGPGGGWVGIVE